MASGLIVGSIHASMPPQSASRAEEGVLAGGSTVPENWPIIAFADAATQYWDFLCSLEGYGGGGLTIEFCWAASVASGNAVWGMAIRRLVDDAEDLDTAHTYDFNTTAVAAASAIGELSYDTIAFTSGADMDSLANKERFLLRVQRLGSDASDTLAGIARLLYPLIMIRET